MSDGSLRFFLSKKEPLQNEFGIIIGMVGISLDITEQKQAEEREKLAVAQAAREKITAERELRQAITILAGSIAHDLRTPIAIMEINGNTLKKFLPILLEVYFKAKEEKILCSDQNMTQKQLKRLEIIGQSIQKTLRQMHSFIDVSLRYFKQSIKRRLDARRFNILLYVA